MYNRYILQADGTHKKCKLPEPIVNTPPPPKPKPTAKPQKATPSPDICPPPAPDEPVHRPPVRQKKHVPERDSISGFFKQLLPGEIETADLLIILLLLLMAGDCEEDRNNALLTLALYFLL